MSTLQAYEPEMAHRHPGGPLSVYAQVGPSPNSTLTHLYAPTHQRDLLAQPNWKQFVLKHVSSLPAQALQPSSDVSANTLRAISLSSAPHRAHF